MKTTLCKYTAAAAIACACLPLVAQEVAPEVPEDDDVIVLSPFEVTAETEGYYAGTTLAGNRLSSELRDLGNAVTVISSQMLKDIGATDNQTLLQYTTNTEVGSVFGNFVGGGDGSLVDESNHFTNPNQNTRVRGLTSADNTRDYFKSDIPWEGYNIDGVDLQRGPNSILFGQGSPAGIINTRTKQATFKDQNEVSLRVGSWGSNRETLDINKVLLKNELAIRLAAVRNDEKYKQDPAYSLQKRAFGALRYEPGFLKRGSARTIIKANVEFGDIESNNPRQLPPLDAITPWFQSGTFAGRNVAGEQFNFPYLNKLTVIPSQNEDDNTGLPNHGFNRPSHNGPSEIGGTPNEYYQPWIGRSFGNQFGNPSFNFVGDNPVQGTGIYWEPTSAHGMSPNGTNRTRTNGLGFMPFQRPAGVAGYAEFAQNARLPFSSSGVYRNNSLTDATIFDFYNQLLDGPTKREWQNFRVYNVSIAQTFLNDRLGIEAVYNDEHYRNGNVRFLGGDQQNITIDMNSVYSDGTPTGLNGEPHADGTPNPNVGRPVLSGDNAFGNGSFVSDRETGRVTGFADIDFNRNERNGFTRLLGRHVFTGMTSVDKQSTDRRSWSRYSIDDQTYEQLVNNRLPTDPAYVPLRFMDARMMPYTYLYLGPSLLSASSASGANIPNPKVSPVISSGNVRVFDATWTPSTNPMNSSYVDPAAYWRNDYYPTNNVITGLPDTRGDSTQSENHANYVGWRTHPINVIDSENTPGGRDLNTRDAALNKSRLSTKAFNWQAHFWDKAIVATWGIRKDTEKVWAKSVNENNHGVRANNSRLDLSPNNPNNATRYVLPEVPGGEKEVTSRAWTAVAHINQFPWINKMKLPVQVSVFYNHSTDFQPAAQRVDIYGEPLAPPSGKTKDVGILLETHDGRYSLKVNKYVTTSTDQSSSALQHQWFIGSSQAWAANWVNRFEFNWTADNNAGAVAVPDPTNTQYNYEPAPGESLAQAQAREASVIAAWRTWQAQVDPRFYTAWGINLNDPSRGVSATGPNGLSVTEDSRSEGYEIELSATPTRNWRLAVNASQSKAQRTNIGGTNLRAFVNQYVEALNNGAPGGVGDLRIWWGGAGNETTLLEWYTGNQPFGSVFAQRALQEGTDVPELREWRVNGITNYDFDHGRLKGFNIGGGVRYESPIIIGYRPIFLNPALTGDDSPANTTYDLTAPFEGPRELNFDLWVGYRRRLWDKVDWHIQMNVRNVGVGNELIPITTQPDGAGATYRIRPPQLIQLTSTFNF